MWALPGTKGVEHRVGGLEKDSLSGAVSHDPENHERMVGLRAAKVARVQDFIPKQEVVGGRRGELLVVGWGGTYGHLLTAVRELQRRGEQVSLCHFNFIHPLPRCELNSGQFAGYLRQQFQEFEFLRYNKIQGLPFTVTELRDEFARLLKS